MSELTVRSFMEGARIRASVGLYRDVVEPMTIKDGDRTLHLKTGERVMVDLVRRPSNYSEAILTYCRSLLLMTQKPSRTRRWSI